MAMLNRRNKKQDVLPEEVREYYQAERRERTGFAWLLALGTLVVTILIAAGLFFGGRWAYRAVFDNDSKDTATQQDEGLRVDEKGNVDGTVKQGDEAADATPGGPAGTPTAGTTQQGTTTTPNTGATELVNTGPGDEL